MSSNPYASNAVPPPPKSSSKLWMGLGCGCMVMLGICCGGVMLFGIGSARWAQNAAISDPQQIDQLAKQIAEVPLIDELAVKPKFGMDMKIPFLDRRLMRFAVYTDEAEHSMVLIGDFDAELMGGDTQKALREMQTGMQGGGHGQQDVQVMETAQKQLTVRGKPAQFTFAKVKMTPDGKTEGVEMWQVTGVFEGKAGPALLLIMAPYEDWTQAELEAEVQQIK